MYIYHIFFIHSSIGGHWVCFHILAIVDNATVNLGCIYLFKLVFLFSLGKYTEVKLLDLMAVMFLPFLRNLYIVFHSGCANLQSHHWCIQFSSVTQSCPTLCDSMDSRLPCPSPAPYSNSCPSSQWCHPTISSSVIPFSSCLQSFPASGSFPMSQFSSGGQSIGVLASVLPINILDWFPLGWTGWISLQSRGLSRVFSNTTVQKHQFFSTQLFFIVQHSHPYTTTGKSIALTRQTFVDKVMSVLFKISCLVWS